jgi:hypothetical protein
MTALARLSEIEARHMHDQAGDGEPPCCRNCMTDVPALCAALRVAVEALGYLVPLEMKASENEPICGDNPRVPYIVQSLAEIDRILEGGAK